MTIDEHIEQLKKLKSFHNGSYGESVNFAIDIIRNYERIVQIIEDYETDMDRVPEWMPHDWWYIGQIREVIEDGNDNL